MGATKKPAPTTGDGEAPGSGAIAPFELLRGSGWRHRCDFSCDRGWRSPVHDGFAAAPRGLGDGALGSSGKTVIITIVLTP